MPASFEEVSGVHIGVGLVSILGGLLVLAMFYTHPQLRQDQLGAMVYFVTWCDLLFTLKFFVSAIAWQLGLHDNRWSFFLIDDSCTSSEAYGMFFSVAIVAWNACWVIDLIVVLNSPLVSTRKNMPWYHALVWGTAVSATIYVLATWSHERAKERACWIRAQSVNSTFFDIFLAAYTLLALGSIAFAIRASTCAGTRFSRAIRWRILVRHAAYVAAFVFMWAIPIIHRFVDDDYSIAWLARLDATSVSGQAATLALVRLSEPGAARVCIKMLRDWAARIALFLGLRSPGPGDGRRGRRRLALASAAAATATATATHPHEAGDGEDGNSDTWYDHHDEPAASVRGMSDQVGGFPVSASKSIGYDDDSAPRWSLQWIRDTLRGGPSVQGLGDAEEQRTALRAPLLPGSPGDDDRDGRRRGGPMAVLQEEPDMYARLYPSQTAESRTASSSSSLLRAGRVGPGPRDRPSRRSIGVELLTMEFARARSRRSLAGAVRGSGVDEPATPVDGILGSPVLTPPGTSSGPRMAAARSPTAPHLTRGATAKAPSPAGAAWNPLESLRATLRALSSGGLQSLRRARRSVIAAGDLHGPRSGTGSSALTLRDRLLSASAHDERRTRTSRADADSGGGALGERSLLLAGGPTMLPRGPSIGQLIGRPEAFESKQGSYGSFDRDLARGPSSSSLVAPVVSKVAVDLLGPDLGPIPPSAASSTATEGSAGSMIARPRRAVSDPLSSAFNGISIALPGATVPTEPLVRNPLIRLRSNSAGDWLPGTRNPFMPASSPALVSTSSEALAGGADDDDDAGDAALLSAVPRLKVVSTSSGRPEAASRPATVDGGPFRSGSGTRLVDRAGELRSDDGPLLKRVLDDASTASIGSGWDVSAGLRLELAMCVLSGLCQSVLQSELDSGVGAAALRRSTAAEAMSQRLIFTDGSEPSSTSVTSPYSAVSPATPMAADTPVADFRPLPDAAGEATPHESLSGPMAQPSRLTIATILGRPGTVVRRFDLLGGFSSARFCEAARKEAMRSAWVDVAAPAAVAPSDSALISAAARRRRSSTRYRPPAGSLHHVVLDVDRIGEKHPQRATQGILDEGAESDDDDNDDDDAGDDIAADADDDDDDDDNRNKSDAERRSRGSRSPQSAGHRSPQIGSTASPRPRISIPSAQSSPRASPRLSAIRVPRGTSDADVLPDPLGDVLGLDLAGSSSPRAVAGTGSPAARREPTVASQLLAGGRRRSRRRSSLLDQFTVASIEDELLTALRAELGVSGIDVAKGFDPQLLRSGELRAHFSEGASRSFFCRSRGEDLIVKTVTTDEVETLVNVLPAYCEHLRTNPDSLLCRFIGLYCIRVRGMEDLYFLLMQNVFPLGASGPTAATFDLKGSTVGRKSRASRSLSSAGPGGLVIGKGVLHQDMDFREMLPLGLPVRDASLRSALVDQLTRDVTLLAAYGLMDYSLLVSVQPVPVGRRALLTVPAREHPGPRSLPRKRSALGAFVSRPTAAPICPRKEEVVVQIGVVDLLQRFDLGKQMENRFKSIMRAGRSNNISAVPAEQYALRFVSFLEDIFSGKRPSDGTPG